MRACIKTAPTAGVGAAGKEPTGSLLFILLFCCALRGAVSAGGGYISWNNILIHSTLNFLSFFQSNVLFIGNTWNIFKTIFPNLFFSFTYDGSMMVNLLH